jgi:hypothetical protein
MPLLRCVCAGSRLPTVGSPLVEKRFDLCGDPPPPPPRALAAVWRRRRRGACHEAAAVAPANGLPTETRSAAALVPRDTGDMWDAPARAG